MNRITIKGREYVLVPVEQWKRQAGESARMPPLPGPDPEGNVPALAYARASIARGIIRDRRAAKLSQAELARRAGIAPETLNRVERAKVTPDESTLRKIDSALKAAARAAARAGR